MYYCYCIEKFRDSSANHNQIPRKTEALHSVIKSAAAEARKVKIVTQKMLVYYFNGEVYFMLKKTINLCPLFR